MKNTSEVKQNVKEKEGHFAKKQKVSSCCGPTCCGGASDTKNKNRKEK